LNSIIRCLKGGTGLAVVPDFLCKNEIESGDVKLIWEGEKKLEKHCISDAEKRRTMRRKSTISKVYSEK
jgi:hypothetical protein